MKTELKIIYKKLYRYFGPQHWWPADSSFEVMVGAVLTQNTSWRNVELAIANLKENKILSAQKIYDLSEKRLAQLIRPSGFYNIKVKRLKALVEFLLRNYKGNIKKMSLVDAVKLRQQLLMINGIGKETADSILLYALNKQVFVVDAYTKRMLLRHKLIKEDSGYDQVQNLFMQKPSLVSNSANKRKKNTICNGPRNEVKSFNEYHALLVRLGKDFCLKNKPKCAICPLR